MLQIKISVELARAIANRDDLWVTIFEFTVFVSTGDQIVTHHSIDDQIEADTDIFNT